MASKGRSRAASVARKGRRLEGEGRCRSPSDLATQQGASERCRGLGAAGGVEGEKQSGVGSTEGAASGGRGSPSVATGSSDAVGCRVLGAAGNVEGEWSLEMMH